MTATDGAVTRGFHSYESHAEDETAAECAEGAAGEVARGGKSSWIHDAVVVERESYCGML